MAELGSHVAVPGPVPAAPQMTCRGAVVVVSWRDWMVGTLIQRWRLTLPQLHLVWRNAAQEWMTRTNPTTSFSRFFHRRNEFVYILIFFHRHKLYCWVSFYLLLEMMQVRLFIVLVIIIRMYIYAISWVLHCIELTGVVLTCTGWRSFSSFLIP